MGLDEVLGESARLAAVKDTFGEKEPRLPFNLLDSAFTIANVVQAVGETQELSLPEEDENRVTLAINLTSGQLLEFYFDALRLLWPTASKSRNESEPSCKCLRP